MGDLEQRSSPRGRRRLASLALSLAIVLALVTAGASHTSALLAEWLPGTDAMSEAPRSSSGPVEKVRSDSLGELGLETFLLAAPAPPPADPAVCLESDGRRPGHRHRIERPPRLAV